MRALAHETGAGTVVSGSYYRQGERLLLRVQVTDAITGTLLGVPDDASAPVSEPIDGIVELRNRLMGWFGLHFDDRIKGHERTDETPPIYTAYVAFGEGMAQYIATRNDLAVPLFLRAYERDSAFVLALLYASIALSNLGEYARADSILRTVSASRDHLSEYHRAWLDSRVAFLRGDNEGVLTAIRRAASLAPQSKAVYNQAVAAFQTGYLTEARDALETLAPDLGPMRGFLPYWDLKTAIAHAMGDFRTELRLGRESVKRFPERLAAFTGIVRALAARGNMNALDAALRDAQRVPQEATGGYQLTYGSLLTEAAAELVAHGHDAESRELYDRAVAWYAASGGRVGSLDERTRLAYAMGRWSDAERMVDSSLASGVDVLDAKGLRGMIAAHRGQRDTAVLITAELAADKRPYSFGTPTLYRARISAILGESDSSLALLRQSLVEGKEYDLLLHRDPDLAIHRNTPAFQAIVQGRRGTLK